jgi:cytochrome c
MLSLRLGLRGFQVRCWIVAAALVLAVLACGSPPVSPQDGDGGGGTVSGGSGGTPSSSSGGSSPSGGGSTGSGGSGDASGGGGGSGDASSGGSGDASGGGSGGGPIDDGIELLVFAHTVEFRHESIAAGVGALQGLADQRGWSLLASEDPTLFAEESLAGFDVVVFLSTTGDVLDGEQQTAFEQFIRSGKGFVGVHAASDTEYDWPWYGELVGAYFLAHPPVQVASVSVEEALHPATVGLPSPWVRTDEWYGFQTNPRAEVQVLLSLDEASFDPGEGSMGGDHPIAWCHEYDGGRSFYTALGHTIESYSEPEFLQHLAGGIEWAAAVD